MTLPFSSRDNQIHFLTQNRIKTMTIEEFIAYLEDGKHQEACKKLYEEYGESLQQNAKKYPWVTNLKGEAMEAIATFWVYVKKKLQKGEKDKVLQIENIGNYLHRILQRQIMKKRPSSGLDPDELIPDEPNDPSPILDVGNSKKQQLKKEALPHLSEKQRQIIRLFYNRGFTHEAIAVEMGYGSADVAKTTLNRAMNKLRKAVNALKQLSIKERTVLFLTKQKKKPQEIADYLQKPLKETERYVKKVKTKFENLLADLDKTTESI